MNRLIYSLVLFSILSTVLPARDVVRSILNKMTTIIDLTHSINNLTVQYPLYRPFEYTRIVADSSRGYWRATKEFCTAEHAGTHVDGPYHFSDDGQRVGEVPLETLITKLVVIDVRKLVKCNRDFVLQLCDVEEELRRKVGKNKKQKVFVIFRFGWSIYYNDRLTYLGGTDSANLHFPGISKELAQFFIDELSQVQGVGTDTASLDPGYSLTYDVHRVLMPENKYIMEHVDFTQTEEREFRNCISIQMVPRYVQGTGSASRLVAICKKK